MICLRGYASRGTLGLGRAAMPYVGGLMDRKLVSFMAALAAWASSSLYAADTAINARLTELQGTVLMNQGQKFVPAKLGTELRAGDRVFALTTGPATVTFPDGCAILIKPGKLMTIGPQSPCT